MWLAPVLIKELKEDLLTLIIENNTFYPAVYFVCFLVIGRAE